jgi:adenine-specific DNA-methyltransferase
MSDVKIHHGDCLDVMATLPDSSVALIVADPPYHRIKDEDWDRQWPTEEDYLAWIGRLCDEWRRVLRPNGSLYCFASPKMAARVEVEIGKRFEVLNQVVWAKHDGNGNGMHSRQHKDDCRAWFPQTERIIFAGLRGIFPSLIRDARLKSGMTVRELTAAIGAYGVVNHGGAVSNWEAGLNVPTRQQWDGMSAILGLPPYEDAVRPFSVDSTVPYTDVWDFPTVPTRPDKHPCEKPYNLISHIIKASSRPGDLVLDPCAGSGVTGEVCRALGRECILIEKDPRYHEMIRWRLAEARIGFEIPHVARPAKRRRDAETPLFSGISD